MPASADVTPDELLRLYDEQVRATFDERVPDAWTVTRDGPVARALTAHEGFAMLTQDASGLNDQHVRAWDLVLQLKETTP